MTSFEQLEQAIYHSTQRDAAQMLLQPILINSAFIAANVQLTLARVDQIKGLLRAIVNDHQHNPSTIRERIMLDITHDLGFLELRVAIWLNNDPLRLAQYLTNRYPQHVQYWTQITLREIDRFQRQLIAIIQEGMR